MEKIFKINTEDAHKIIKIIKENYENDNICMNIDFNNYEYDEHGIGINIFEYFLCNKFPFLIITHLETDNENNITYQFNRLNMMQKNNIKPYYVNFMNMTYMKTK